MRIEKTIDSVQFAPRRMPGQAFVEGLDEADAERAEHGAGEVADPAEDRRRERDEPERKARVVADLPEVERVQQPAGAREARPRSGT